MRKFKLRKGDQLSFNYDSPGQNGPIRQGPLERVFKTKDGRLIFTIKDEFANDEFRSFCYAKMREIWVKVS
jgi:hypothetical protein